MEGCKKKLRYLLIIGLALIFNFNILYAAETTMTVEEGLYKGIGTEVCIQGYIVGYGADGQVKFSSQDGTSTTDLAIVLADSMTEINKGKVIIVKLKGANREDYGLASNPDYLYKKIKVTGKLEAAYNIVGINSPRSLEIVNGPTTGVTPPPEVVVPPTSAVTISQIQGAGHTSPYVNQNVVDVKGVITGFDGTTGFYIQDQVGDGNELTSDGIYVYGNGSNYRVGNLVSVSGKVEEYTASSGNLSVTEIVASKVDVIKERVQLPEPIIIGEGGRIPPTTVIDNDQFRSFDPQEDSIDFYETLEGMCVRVEEAQVVGSDAKKNIFVVPNKGKYSSALISNEGGVVATQNNKHPEIIQVIPEGSDEINVEVGDVFKGSINGILNYCNGKYSVCAQKLSGTYKADYERSPQTRLIEQQNGLRIASMNVENMGGNASKAKIDEVAGMIIHNLKLPDVVVLEEIQDNNGTTNDGTVAADLVYSRLIESIRERSGIAKYAYIEIAPLNNQDGGANGGNIRVGMLYRTDRVSLAAGVKGDSTTATTVVKGVDGKPALSLNPGRIAPNSTAFRNSRKPLVAEFVFNGENVFVIANHFNSKGEDGILYGSTQPAVLVSEAQRIEQAKEVKRFVNQILSVDGTSKIVVLGDLNDYEYSKPIQTLAGNELYNMMNKLETNKRYTYIYEGRSQVLDHALVTKGLEAYTEVEVLHTNTYKMANNRTSDHDPILIRLDITGKINPIVPGNEIGIPDNPVDPKNPDIKPPTDQAVPAEVTASSRYIQLGVCYNGGSTICKELNKKAKQYSDTTQKGMAIFEITGYAYQTGSNVKVGVKITYKDENGNTVSDWWDRVEQFDSLQEAKNVMGFPEQSSYKLTVTDICYENEDNENDGRVKLTIKGSKGEFSRPTNKYVSLQ